MSVTESLILFFVFLGLVFIILGIKKFYHHVYLKKKFNIIPRVNTRGITSIAMVVALSVAVLLLLMIITADVASVIFRAWPGVRIILEGILIKIGGMLFGPIIGICIGGATDFLVISLTAGVFHIGYFVSAMFFGLIGGIIKYIVTLANKNEFRFALFSSFFLIIISTTCIFVLYFLVDDQNFNKVFSFSFLSTDIELTLWNLIVLLIFLILLALLVVWALYFYRKRHYQFCYRGKLLEETYYNAFNHQLLQKINYLKINNIFKHYLNHQEIKILSQICSSTIVNFSQLNGHKKVVYQLVSKGLVKIKDNNYLITNELKTLLISSDYQSHLQKKYVHRYELSKKSKLYNSNKKWYITFMPIFVCVVSSELLVDIMMMPSFDAILSTLSYDTWLLIRIILFAPVVLLNLIIIYPIFRVITPNIKMNIIDDENTPIKRKNILQK